MIDSLHWLTRAADSLAAPLFVDTIVKATLLLMGAGLAAAVLRRASAAARHRVWRLALAGLLVLPALVALLPGWPLAVLPEVSRADGPSAPSDVEASEGPIVAAAPVWSAPGVEVDPLPVADASPVASPEESASPLAAANVTAEAASPISWRTLLGVVWLVGLGVALLPVVVGLMRNRSLARRARPVVDAGLMRLVGELCRSLGVKRPVRLLETDGSLAPMTWGVLRPTLVFPSGWREWTLQRRRVVLLHELAHVKRCDVAFQLLGRLACALYWFHPLAWYALRRLRIERESACDDCVVTSGERASEYAQQLVEIARSHRMPLMPAAVGMARSKRLERRVHALLDGARSHLPVSRGAGRMFLVCAALVVTGMAVVHPTARSQPREEPVATAPEARPSETVAEAPDAVAEPAGETSEEETRLVYRGQVVDSHGEPIAGAKIFPCYWFLGAPLDYKVEPRAVTDDQGRFEYTTARSDFEGDASEAWLHSVIVASANGYGFAAESSLVFETTGKALELTPQEAFLTYFKTFLGNRKPVLRLVGDEAPITGRVVTPDGEPVAGARVGVDRVWYNDEGDLTAWEKGAKEVKADFYSLRTHTKYSINGPQVASIIPGVTTDKDGAFTLPGVGRERIVQLLIRGPGIETTTIKARTRQGEKVVVPHQWRTVAPHDRMETYFGAELEHVAGPSKPVLGRVTDADGGEPIAGVVVGAGQRGLFFSSGSPHIATMTDADGRYRLEGLPVGEENRVLVFSPADTDYLPAGTSVNTKIDGPSATQDFQLKRGILVRGQAVDDRTGKPLAGRVQYLVFRNNPHLEDFSAFTRAFLTHERRAGEDGRFEIAVLPGSGVITFMARDHTRYRRGLGAETITGPVLDEVSGLKMLDTVPIVCVPSNSHVVRQVNAEEGSDGIELTLTLTSGVHVPGHLLDPQGKRLSGGVVSGSVFQGSWYPILGEEFRVEGYYPDRPRDLFFYHPQRDLAAHFRLEGAAPKELTITLQPAGSLRGRLVGVDGTPLAGVMLSGEGVPGENYGDTSLRLATDADGRFHVRGLIPGRTYTVVSRGRKAFGRVLADVTVESAGTTDVGEVRLQPPERAARP